MFKPVKLTKKTAQTLVNQVFPGLKIEGGKCDNGAVVFHGFTGPEASLCRLLVTIENDWNTYNGRIRLAVYDSSTAGQIVMFFHPDTLNRDFLAEDAEREDRNREARVKWVQNVGVKMAHSLVDQYYNRGY